MSPSSMDGTMTLTHGAMITLDGVMSNEYESEWDEDQTHRISDMENIEPWPHLLDVDCQHQQTTMKSPLPTWEPGSST